jgi:hypothetical protein
MDLKKLIRNYIFADTQKRGMARFFLNATHTQALMTCIYCAASDARGAVRKKVCGRYQSIKVLIDFI